MGRICNRCQQFKLLSNFAINSKGKFGVKSICKKCSTKAGRKLYQDRKNTMCPNEWSLEKREQSLKKNYGITLAEYEIYLEKQKGVCLICFGVNSDKPLYVDHCHNTKQVRGLLCQKCNSLLGMAQDSITILASAIDYLKRDYK